MWFIIPGVTVVIFLLRLKSIGVNALLGRTDYINQAKDRLENRETRIPYIYSKSAKSLFFDFFFLMQRTLNINELHIERLRFLIQLLLFQLFFYLNYLASGRIETFLLLNILYVLTAWRKFGWYMHSDIGSTPYTGLMSMGLSLNIILLAYFQYTWVASALLVVLCFLHLVHGIIAFLFLTVIMFFHQNLNGLIIIAISMSSALIGWLQYQNFSLRNQLSAKEVISRLKFIKIRANSLYTKKMFNAYRYRFQTPFYIFPCLILILLLSSLVQNNRLEIIYYYKLFAVFGLSFLFLQYFLSDVLKIEKYRSLALSRGTAYGLFFYAVIITNLIAERFSGNSILFNISILSLIIFSMNTLNIKHNPVLIPLVVAALYDNQLIYYVAVILGLILFIRLSSIKGKLIAIIELSFVGIAIHFGVGLSLILVILFIGGLLIQYASELKSNEKLTKLCSSWKELQVFSKDLGSNNSKFLVPLFPGCFGFYSGVAKTFDAEDSMYPIYAGNFVQEIEEMLNFLNISNQDEISSDYLQLFDDRWKSISTDELRKYSREFGITHIVRKSSDPLLQLNCIYYNSHFKLYKT